ncbi:MAG: 16S rRNA (cytosine(1402)-N(4))-methyltransferase RsmH [Actinomycetota bacterium]
MSSLFTHVPVLASEVVAWLGPALERGSGSGAGRALLVDCTLGGGGHAAALLGAAPDAALLGLDRDPAALAAARDRLAPFGNRVSLMLHSFGDLSGALALASAESVDAALYDLGVSSPQLDLPERGFGFRSGGPLDMRMDPSAPTSAAAVVNGYSADELSRVIGRYGEERFARRIASAIVRRRTQRPFTATDDLAEVVKEAIPAATRRTGGHPARRTFQALRIEVNDELGQLQRSLPEAIDALAPGGRVAVISYHSLEDRIVKRTFADAASGCTCPRDLPVCACGAQARLRVLTRRPVLPTELEVARNPRASSGRLRVAERLSEAA